MKQKGDHLKVTMILGFLGFQGPKLGVLLLFTSHTVSSIFLRAAQMDYSYTAEDSMARSGHIRAIPEERFSNSTLNTVLFP